MDRVLFQEKSSWSASWQDSECPFCGEMATTEAVCGRAHIRCCGKEACKELAAKEAQAIARADEKNDVH